MDISTENKMTESNIFLLENYFFNPHSIPIAITFLLILSLGLAVFYREKASHVGWLYLLYSSTLFTWFAGMFLLYSSTTQEIGIHWAKLSNSGVVFIPPAFFLLSVVILNIYYRNKIFVILSWLISAGMFLLLHFSNNFVTGLHEYSWGLFASYGKTTLIFILFFSMIVSRTLYMYWKATRDAPENSILKKRTKLLFIGFMVGSIASIDFLPAYGIEIYPLGFLFISLLYLYTTYIIWNHKLVDITPEFASMQLLETMEESVIVVDTDNTIRLINAASCQLLESNKNILLNKDATSIIPEIDFTNLNKKIVSDNELSQHKIQITINDSKVVTLKLSARKLYDKSDDVVAFLYVMHDITLQHEAEKVLLRDKDSLEKIIQERTEELTAEKEHAEEASQAKTKFLSVMSHELRTPLNAILGFTELMKINEQEPLTELQSKSVNHVINSGQHLLELITDILDLSRIETDNLKISLEPLNLDEILNDIVKQISSGIAKQKNITINNHNKNTNAKIIADKTRITQVLINILSNAIKYNNENGEVIINTEERPNNKIRVLISDTGIGIKNEGLELIFEPFERFEHSHSNIEGSGVGLTVSKKLTEAMQGTIGVESIYGEGSTFWIEMPSS